MGVYPQYHSLSFVLLTNATRLKAFENLDELEHTWFNKGVILCDIQYNNIFYVVIMAVTIYGRMSMNNVLGHYSILILLYLLIA